MKTKLLSIFALLLMAATGAWAQTPTLLTTIESTGENASFKSGSKTFNNIATVTLSGGEFLNDDDFWGWYSYEEGATLTVTAVEGYTITSCKFYTVSGSAEDSEAPFQATMMFDYELDEFDAKVNGSSIGKYGVTKIEVYGYASLISVTGVTLSQTEAALNVGETLTLTATVAPDNATDKTVTWTTSDASVATVANGVVTAVGAGTATITVKTNDGAKTATCTVTVSNPSVELTDGQAPSELSGYTGKTVDVIYTRPFTAGKASTVCLPFEYVKKSGEKFYAFTSVSKDGDDYVADMTEDAAATLTANTPYLFMPSTTGDVNFSGTYTIPAAIKAGKTVSGDWTFTGTYETKEWEDAPTGIYGFSAQDTEDGISQGQFVKVGKYVFIKPMRAYLMYKGGSENYAAVRMKAPTRGAADEMLPETISVRLIDADGEVSAIGTLNTVTGKVSLDGWYTLSGKRLMGQPTQKGIYVNNGKKVIIK